MPLGVYPRKTTPPLIRFWSHVTKTETCWLWTGAKNQLGYGVFWDGTRKWVAHRYLYETSVGPVGRELDLDHLCRVRNCVRLDHLDPVTHHENVKRGMLGPLARERNLARTACPQGHAWAPETTAYTKAGYRVCIPCRRASDRKRFLLYGRRK